MTSQYGETTRSPAGEVKGLEKSGGQDKVAKPKPGIPRRLRDILDKAVHASPVEIRGVLPVPLEERTSTRYSSHFSIWACMNINLLPITFGMLGPTYGLRLRDCALVILFFSLLTAAIPVYLGTLGPKTGLRQMIQARYSFGRYLVSVPVILNLATLTGFCVITCVVGGQCLSAVRDGSVSEAVGIVIIGLLALLISFCGYDVLHQYEQFAYIPALICFAIVAGCGGSHFREQVDAPPMTAKAVLSFGMIIASYMIPYAALASDFTTYLNPKFPSWRLFLYGYAGLVIPPVLLLTLGAAIGGAVSSVPEWAAGYEGHTVGGVLGAVLEPAGGFGKFVLVILSLTLLGNVSATMYSISLNFQILIPQLVVVPRYLYSIVITAIVIPVSIRAATDFFLNLENFIAMIAYWSAAFVAVVIVEHLAFRRGRYETYDHDAWNCTSRLPLGVAALTSATLSFALVIPCMNQMWYNGPIAVKTADIGFEMAFAVTAFLYLPLRALEKRYTGR
ncbi:hypothetical protein DL763_002191 [Monosporascus cannonballus]|nr:hypothetical protein DL763_002191 [Monosporascus cannonballus]